MGFDTSLTFFALLFVVFYSSTLPNMESYTKACEEVKEAGEWSKAIPNERKLISYGLFKQITSGDNTSAAPWAVRICSLHPNTAATVTY